MLIDKQDELCLIYEQFSRHEEVMRRGEIALREREEEHKLLSLQLRDFLRQIEIMRRKVPQLHAYDAEIADLNRQLERERKDVDKVTAKLEAPDLKERQRAYCGRDFTLNELEDKVSLYEQRINSKEQQLWEKQILLREIEEKIAELQHATGADDPITPKLYEKSGSLRSESMSLRRKKMATLAETAVYQAQSEDLKEVKENLHSEIEMAIERTAKGEDFDERASKMLRMHERDMRTSSLGKEQGEFESDDEEDRRPGRQHFDAYPTADGLSRPYGAFPVFQPGAPSGQLRHFRKETQRPIEL
jgi:chromosome segregation ATPase